MQWGQHSGTRDMKTTLSKWLLVRMISRPGDVFRELAETEPEVHVVFFRYLIWLALLPPLFAYIGADTFGWRIGAEAPLHIPASNLVFVSLGYFSALLFGFFSISIVSRWMAPTYGARESPGVHLAFVCIIAAPLVAGSVFHLFPHVFINILVLIPALMWSMYLLYRGLPVVLGVTPENGMLMASSLIAYLLVAAVSLLGITVAFWGEGVGPTLGV